MNSCVCECFLQMILSFSSLSCHSFYLSRIHLRKWIFSIILIWGWGCRLSVDKRERGNAGEGLHESWVREVLVIIEAHWDTGLFCLSRTHCRCRINLLSYKHTCTHFFFISLHDCVLFGVEGIMRDLLCRNERNKYGARQWLKHIIWYVIVSYSRYSTLLKICCLGESHSI